MSENRKLCLNGCFRIKPVSDFAPHARSKDGLASRCRPCELERVQRLRHGMSAAEKAALAAEQGGCAACGRQDPGAKGWVVDHDHSCCEGAKSCGRCRRGILCRWCNSALGYAFDEPAKLRALADYLDSGVRIDQSDVDRVGMAIRLSESVDRAEIAARTERRRDKRTHKASYSPTSDISPFVTRTRAYGLADVDEIQPHPKFAPPKADETRAAHLDRLRRNMEASA